MINSTSKPPYKDRLRQRTGQIQVPPGHLGVVFRDGKFARFLQPGWNNRPSPWDEQFMVELPIKFYQVETKLAVKSADGFAFKAVMNIEFMFNPDKATGPNRAERIMIALSADVDNIVKNQVMKEAKYCLAATASDYLADDLVGGQARTRLARTVRHHLYTVLSDQGIVFQSPSSVFIESLTPPKALINSQVKFYERQKTITMLEQHPKLALQTVLLEASTQPNHMMFRNRTLLHNFVETLYMDAFATSNKREIFPNGLRQNATVYANTSTKNNGDHIAKRR